MTALLCPCGNQPAKLALDQALDSGKPLVCKWCGKEIELSAELAIWRIVTLMAADLKSVRRIAVAFMWIFVLSWVVVILGWVFSESVSHRAVTNTFLEEPYADARTDSQKKADDDRQRKEVEDLIRRRTGK